MGVDVTHRINDRWNAGLFLGQSPIPIKSANDNRVTAFRVANGYDPEWFRITGMSMEKKHYAANAAISANIQTADVTIFQSNWAKSNLEQMLGVLTNQAYVFNNGVDLELFKPDKTIVVGTPVIGMVGVFRYRYRLEVFFEMASRIGQEVKLLLIGSLDDECSRLLKFFQSDPKIRGKLTYHEYFPQNSCRIITAK